MRIPFEHTYAALAPRFGAPATPTKVPAPRLIRLNRALAGRLGLDADALDSELGAALFGGNVVAEGARPIALAYAGHQFGHFVPQLGDGRAILLGELRDVGGARFDVQLKGAGPTPFSRRGDGRAALGPVLREYLLSEAMAALGVPTTRALAAVATGAPVFRETALPGAVITRVAASHVRVGTFQFFAARQDHEALRLLADHVIARHYPEVAAAHPSGGGDGEPDGARYLALIEAVAARQASLVAAWLSIGFVHGVMNTDNTQIAGETLDYGPCAFLDEYDPGAVFSSIDHQGRYAYANQPRIAQWNLARFAETLLPLLGVDEAAAVAKAEAVLAGFGARFDDAYLARMRRKLGLAEAHDGDLALLEELLGIFARAGVDFTNGFRALSARLVHEEREAPDALPGGAALDAWESHWRARLSRESREGRDLAEVRRAMDATNPAVIPRNHLVEAVIRAAVDRDDFAPFDALLAEVERPFDARPPGSPFTQPPRPEERVTQTFCGT
jgi:uncharacterized protein YdiU (UPF0061 family)